MPRSSQKVNITLTKENVNEYIDAGIVYRTDTLSGWGMITEIFDENDYRVTDLPQVRVWLQELNDELQARQDAYL